MATLGRGRKAILSNPEISELRELTRLDIAHLAQKRSTPQLQSLRDNHHRLARAVASGISNHEVAIMCGVSYNRVAVLKADPTFADLVAHYRGILTAEWASQDTVIEYMKSNALKAAAMLSDKLEEAAEKGEFLPTRDLVAIQEFGFDRTGYGKVNKNVNVNVDFAAHLEAARSRSARAPALRQIEAEPQLLRSPPVGRPPAQQPARPAVPPLARRF